MDYFTKWPEVCPIPNQEASTVADALVTDSFCRFGVPRELHSDQGRNLESRLMQEVLQRLGVGKTRTTPPSPTVGRHGAALREDDRRASEEGGLHTPEGLGGGATNIPTGLSRFDARHHWHDAC
jgi:hypothetical protein